MSIVARAAYAALRRFIRQPFGIAKCDCVADGSIAWSVTARTSFQRRFPRPLIDPHFSVAPTLRAISGRRIRCGTASTRRSCDCLGPGQLRAVLGCGYDGRTLHTGGDRATPRPLRSSRQTYVTTISASPVRIPSTGSPATGNSRWRSPSTSNPNRRLAELHLTGYPCEKS